ncbi:phosphate ABC transporter permease subunit PstC [Dactylosporangium sp. CA-139066]|uniref:phosphate ABC transporter permease subunit PstC n=1 Tax=Dactylosporangium sp. CA-139066 TaxID=3239930 RepID=UPI003D8F54C0
MSATTVRPTRRKLVENPGPTDRIFRGVARSGGSLVLVLMVLVGTFLVYRAWEALSRSGFSFITTETWNPDGGGFGIAAVIVGTVLIAIIAILVAVPLAMGTALYISEYAPRWLKRWAIMGVDLMAAVPSVVFGLWGAFFLQWWIVDLSRWISDWFGWIPIFKVDGVERHDPLATPTAYTSSAFIAGVVVAFMVAPIACSVMREAFGLAPVGEREGAFALGATKWGMIRSVVLPFGRGAAIGGTMLGLGRALGETIAVVMIISPRFEIQPHVLEHGTGTVSALIALRYGEASPFGISALMAAGVALFVLTLLVNFGAAWVVSRSRSGAMSEV